MSKVEHVKTVCRSCHGGCGVIAHVQDGKFIKVEGDSDSPISYGTLCAKGLAITQLAYHPDRILYPMKKPVETGNEFKQKGFLHGDQRYYKYRENGFSTPTGDAISRNERGIVLIDDGLCIGCRGCIDACPFDAIQFEDRREVAVKCDLCHLRLAKNKQPACVSVCLTSCSFLGGKKSIAAVFETTL